MQNDLTYPCIMGILNRTPDSFSDGGRFLAVDAALHHVEYMIASGAQIIDIGGESTRPGAEQVSLQIELDRTLPLLEKIKAEFPVFISIDTNKAAVMQAAIAAGADMINDIKALQNENALMTVSNHPKVKVCLMHLQGEPRSMQQNPQYHYVVTEVKQFLLDRIETCLTAGISADRIIIDPGFGFGKTLAHNLQLMRGLSQLTELNYPVLIGISRKSMLGALLNKTTDQRLYGGLALTTYALLQGAAIIRTHDVAETQDVLKVTQALLHHVDS